MATIININDCNIINIEDVNISNDKMRNKVQANYQMFYTSGNKIVNIQTIDHYVRNTTNNNENP